MNQRRITIARLKAPRARVPLRAPGRRRIANGAYLHVNCYHMNSEDQEWYWVTAGGYEGFESQLVAYRAPDTNKTADSCPGVSGL